MQTRKREIHYKLHLLFPVFITFPRPLNAKCEREV